MFENFDAQHHEASTIAHGHCDRLGDQALAVRRRLHGIGRRVLKSPAEEPSVASRVKIEIIRDICEQPAALPNQQNQPGFPLFAEFPTEIRLLIWHFASTAGRVVELQWSSTSDIGFRNCAAPRPPAVLHTCRDSRKEALKIFRPYFSMQGRRKPIYVDPVNDILFFRVPHGFFQLACGGTSGYIGPVDRIGWSYFERS